MNTGSAGTGLAGLVATSNGTKTSLVAIWRDTPGAAWALSRPLSLAGTTTLASVGFGLGRELFVVKHEAGGRSALATINEGSGWVTTALPNDTVTVGFDASGGASAITVGATLFEDWIKPSADSTWKVGQTMEVPVPFGSSG